MANYPLSKALTNASYELVGNKHQALLEAARSKEPNAHGAKLATVVLSLLHPELAQHAQRDGDAFFAWWLKQHGGEHPKSRWHGLFAARRSAEDEMEEDLRWIGLAAWIAFVGGAFVLHLAPKRSEGASPPLTHPTPIPASNAHLVRFAVAAFSGKVRDAGATAVTAGDLLTHAAFWWAGTADKWDAIVQSASLSMISGIPETDDALLVFVYEAPITEDGAPSSRPEGATRMREAARAGELQVIGTFAIGEPANLSVAGFRR